MFKKIFLLLACIVYLAIEGKSQIQSCKIDPITWDTLYKEISYVPNARDTIFFYEKLIDCKISSAIDSLQMKSDASISKEIRSNIIDGLLKLQKTYKGFIDNETALFFLSYGSFNGRHERGKLSGYFQVYLLKKEYFYVSAIIDNVFSNFILH